MGAYELYCMCIAALSVVWIVEEEQQWKSKR